MRLSIGKDIADTLNFKKGQRINFSVDEDNTRVWLLKKSIDDYGFKISQAKSSNNIMIQISIWKEYIPNQEEMKLRKVDYEFFDGGLMVFTM